MFQTEDKIHSSFILDTGYGVRFLSMRQSHIKIKPHAWLTHNTWATQTENNSNLFLPKVYTKMSALPIDGTYKQHKVEGLDDYAKSMGKF